jgi:hypothetical protein
MVALIGPSFAQDAPAVGKSEAQTVERMSARRDSEGREALGRKLCCPEPTAPPVAEAEPPKDAMRGEQH